MDWTRFFRRLPKTLHPTRPSLELLEDRIVPSPVLTVPSNQTVSEGQSVSLFVSATDSGGGTMTYTVASLPAGLALNSSTGLISGLVAYNNYNNPTPGFPTFTNATVTVTDTNGTDSASLGWIISDTNRLPSVSTTLNNAEADMVSLDLHGTDVTGTNSLSYSASDLPPGLSINASTGLLSGRVGYNAVNGTTQAFYNPTITLSDNHGGFDLETLSWNISDTNRLPSVGSLNGWENQSVSLDLHATDLSGTNNLSYSVSGLPAGLSLDTHSGLLSGVIGPNAGDVTSGLAYTPTVVLSDNHGGTDSWAFSWAIYGPDSITFAPLLDQWNVEGQSVSLPVQATDSNFTATLSYSVANLPAGLTLNASTGLISGTVASGSGNAGNHAVFLSATDGSVVNGEGFIWDIASSISLTNPGTQSSTEQNTVSLQIVASDSDSGSLMYDATNLPMGLAISPTSGLISGTVALGAAAQGPYQTSLLVTNGGFTSSTLFTWNVAGHVTLTNPGSQNNPEGGTVALSLSASDSTPSSTLAYGASGLPTGLKINPGTGVITGTVALNAAANGPYTVTVVAGDGTSSNNQTFTWNVSVPITMVNDGTQNTTEGHTVSLSLTTSDSVVSSTLAYLATGLPEGLKINTSTGLITGTVAVGAAQVGPYTTTVEAGDSTYSASQTFTWNVSSPVAIAIPDDQTSGEGATVSLAVTVNDSRASVTLAYGAVGLPAGLHINSSTGGITGTVAAGAAGSGPYAVLLLASDGTYSDTEQFNWTVTNNITLTDPPDQSNTTGDTVSLQVTAVDLTTATLSYSASGLPDGVSINASTGLLTGTLSTGGDWEPTLTAYDGTATTTQEFNWDVSGSIAVTDPGPQANNAGETVSLQVQASDTATGALTYSVSGLPSGLSINSTSGLISGTLAATLSVGVSLSTVTVTDGSNTEKWPLAWAIYPSSQVAVTNPGTKSTSEGSTISLSFGHSYSGTGTLVYSAEGLPMGLAINPSTGLITGTVDAGDCGFGPFEPTVTATDGTSTDTQAFTWNISSAVALTDPADQTSTEGSSVSLALSTSYAGTASLVYSALGLPSGLAVNPSTGVISGTVAVNAAASGPYSVVVVAAAGASSNSQTFNWTVNSPIAITAPADQTTSEGGTVSLTLSTTDSVGGSTLHYAADSLPFGLKINPSTGTITGTVAVGTAAEGPYFVTVLAEDGTYSSTQTFNWTVNSPIALTDPADQTTNEGSTVALTLSATDSLSLNYAALGLPTGLVINPSTGAITGTIAAGASADGPYAVTIEAEDGTYSTTQTFNWNVNSPVAETLPNDQSNNQGDSVSMPIQASDAIGGATLTYAATGLPNGVSLNASTGLITGTLSAGGFWEPTVTVSGRAYSSTQTFAWSVSSPVSITDPGFASNSEGETVSLSVQAADTAVGTLSYSASGLPSGLTIAASTGIITGTITSGDSASSPYFPTITVGDGTHSSVDSFEWDVGSSATVVITSPGSQTNTAGDGVFLPLQSSDSSGGTLMYTPSGLPGGLYLNPRTGQILGTVASNAASGSPYSVTISATDGTNSGSLTFSWTINAAGTATLANPGDQTNNEGDNVSVSLSATDTGGTAHYAAFGLPAGLKLNPSTGAISGTVALGDAAYGPYTVTVVANDGTNSAQQTFLWNVNSPISLTAPSDQTNNEGDSVTLALSASDSINGSTLTYSALGLPAGLKINPSTGAITGTVAKGAAQAGPYSVTIYAEDGTYSTEQTFNWNVNSPVAITIPDDQTNNEGDSVTLALSASDAISGSTLHYTALGLPAGLSINTSTGVISGTVALGNSAIGSFSPTIIGGQDTV